MLLKNDIITFKVQNKTVSKEFTSYNEAETFAKTLDFAFINIKAVSPCGQSGLSATVSKVKLGNVEMIHERYSKCN